jgi:hypothetical protein
LLILWLGTAAQAANDSAISATHIKKAPSLTGKLRPEEWSEASVVGEISYRVAYDNKMLYLDEESKKDLPLAVTVGFRGAHRSNTLFIVLHGSSTYRVSESFADGIYRASISIPWTSASFAPEDEPITVEVKAAQAGPSALFQCGEPPTKKSQGDLLLSPFVLGSVNSENSGYANAGLDYKTQYRDLTLRGSINPDFRTVERAILNLDFSYYPRYAPETRPFFIDGASYFSPTFLASQLIDTFNAGEKVYGNLDKDTTVGVMDTANFWDQNEFVAGISHEYGKLDISAGFKDLHDLAVNSQFSSGSISYKDGPFRFNSDIQVTHDDQMGGGDSADATISYSKNGTFARVTGTDTTSQFFDRLGYYIQPDLRGVEATAGARKAYPSGTLADSGFTLFSLQLQNQSGAQYQNYVGGSASLDFKNGIGLNGFYTAGRFLVNKDRFGELTLTDTVLGGRGKFGLEFTDGILASSNYTNVLPYFAYRFSPKFEVSGSFQAVRQFDNQTQTIVNFNYDLAKNQSLSGRVVEFQNQWNAYLRYRHAVNEHFIYEVIIGDPNATRTQRALWLKMIFPMDVKF